MTILKKETTPCFFYSSFKKWYTNTNKNLGSNCVRINFNKIQKAMGTRLGFVLTLLILYWLKTLLAYTVDFNLDIQLGKLQGNYLAFIAFFNPLPLGLLLMALALYARSTKIFSWPEYSYL